MKITIDELSVLDEMISDYDDRIEIAEIFLSDSMNKHQRGYPVDEEEVNMFLEDIEAFRKSRLLLFRLLNEAKLNI